MQALRQHRSVFVELPTGTGKTCVFGMLVRLAVDHQRRALILVHRDELVTQAVKRLKSDVDVIADIEKAQRKAQPWSEIVVASVQTLAQQGKSKVINGHSVSGNRIERWPRDFFNLIVIDECHHAAAETWQIPLNYFEHAKVVGVTATSDRADGISLDGVFDTCAYSMTMQDAIEQGWLVPVWQKRVRVPGLDLSQIRRSRSADGISIEDQAKILSVVQNIERMAFPAAEFIGGEKGVVFNASVNDSKVFAELLRKCDIEAESVYQGKGMSTKRRREIVKAFKRGDIQVLCNVDVLTEGFDDPEIRSVIMARWTLSRTVYAQQCGRGTRPLPGVVDGLPNAAARRAAIAASDKPYVKLIDFVGNSDELKLCSSPMLIAPRSEDQEVLDKVQEIIENEDGGMAAQEALELARRLVEEARKRKPQRLAYSQEDVDPFYKTAPGEVMQLLGLRRSQELFPALPSPRQMERLRDYGVEEPEKYTRLEAAEVLQRLDERKAKGKATIRMARTLARTGTPPDKALQMSFRTAARQIDELRANNWQSTTQSAAL